MKARSSIKSRILLPMAGILAVGVCVVAVRARADVWDKKTVLTVHEPIQVQETYLDPGKYVFQLHGSSSNRHIVQIFNEHEDHLINTIMAIPSYRLQVTGDTRFTFYETPQGTVRAMREWFYPGDNFGREFRYPKHLRQIAMAASPQETRPPEPPPPPIVTRPAEPEPAPIEQPKAAEQPQEEQLIARAKPEPRPEPAPAPAEPAPKEEKELPKSGTSLPMIGLGGLLSLAACGLLRISRMA